MKGYFSQLADRTPLNFEHGRNFVASGLQSQTVASGHETRRPTPSLDIEDISFTSSPQVTASRSFETIEEGSAHRAPIDIAREATISTPESKDADSRMTVVEIPQPAQPLAIDQNITAHTMIDAASRSFVEESYARYVTPESKTTEHEGRLVQASGFTKEREAVHGPNEGEAAHLYLESLPPVPKASVPKPIRADLPESIEIVGGRSPERDEPSVLYEQHLKSSGQPQSIKEENQEQSQPARVEDKGARGQAAFQDYFREVIEWVSAPPETLERPLEPESNADARTTKNPLAAEDESPAPRSSSIYSLAREEPEVLDLNLSIGTISVVIEEQEKQTATPPPIVASHGSDDRRSSRTGVEPTSLSRYYLRSW
ncbi:MAG TPA: hypothetical protein VKB86_22470 [Pyrinomonadaceae bacterium]|nr:hypothetical protein [Pyrinomonadaceae bacterium]